MNGGNWGWGGRATKEPQLREMFGDLGGSGQGQRLPAWPMGRADSIYNPISILFQNKYMLIVGNLENSATTRKRYQSYTCHGGCTLKRFYACTSPSIHMLTLSFYKNKTVLCISFKISISCYWRVFLHTLLHAFIVVVWSLVGHCFGVASMVRNEGVGRMEMRRQRMALRSTWHLRPPHRPATSGSGVVSQRKRELQQWLQGHLLSHWGTLNWEVDTLAQGHGGWNWNPGFLIVCPESFLFFH